MDDIEWLNSVLAEADIPPIKFTNDDELEPESLWNDVHFLASLRTRLASN